MPTRRFHVMVKPTGAACNLNCAYCYYRGKVQLLEGDGSRRMTDELLEQYIRQYIEGQDCEEIVFSWQGGEPTLLGVEFFERVVHLQRKYRPPGVRIENDLQTNGTLLDDEWCRFLRANGFLVGLSIDGPEHLHDRYRLDTHGGGSFQNVMRGARLLSKHGVPFNTLTVVNYTNAKEPLQVYRFLRDVVKSTRMQFIPCVEPRVFEHTAPQFWDAKSLPMLGTPRARPGAPDSFVTDWSVDPDDWGRFLCSVFDEWYARDIGRVFVYLFECAVAQWMGMPAPLCAMAETCGTALAMERDGNVYACDHYVYPQYCRGNITGPGLSRMVFSDAQAEFGVRKRDSLPQRCKACRWLFACNGECPKNRFIRTPEGEPDLNYLCSGLQQFFAHADRPLHALAQQLSSA